MSIHSYIRCWIHMIWRTKNSEKRFSNEVAQKLSVFFKSYCLEKEIYHKVNYVNSDHIHMLFDLPTKYSLENIAKLLKGTSSNWINDNAFLSEKFSWGRGYGCFSVSQSAVNQVVEYIVNQKEHHKKLTYQEEYEKFIAGYHLKFKNR